MEPTTKIDIRTRPREQALPRWRQGLQQAWGVAPADAWAGPRLRRPGLQRELEPGLPRQKARGAPGPLAWALLAAPLRVLELLA